MTIDFLYKMSITEYKFYELKAFKPKLKMNPGDLVFPIEDEKPKLFVIVNFISYSINAEPDYICCRLTGQGKLITKEFWQKELKKVES